ncbi:MAG: DUF3006 domain-containing protein [Treponema sp.]|nr:DUF3006 domain-containing protein [Treponema sp.]
MRFIVDRIEEGIALCACMETGEEIAIEIAAGRIPAKIKEGDVIFDDGAAYIYDEELTKKRRADLTARMNRLFDK